MRKIAFFFPFVFCFYLFSAAQQVPTVFESSGGMQTPAYTQIIDWWKKLDALSPKVQVQPMGMTDAGFPLHLVTISESGDFSFPSARKKNRRIILINNGIHPGEPDGIDASMLLARDIASRKYSLPPNVILAIIPVYNIGGCLNRSANYRVDQNGPEEFGFRGNSQNLDLNRDFIKCDSRDARAFAEIFHLTDPDVFVDNHVSNGADYQHVMTLLSTQHNKLGGAMGDFLENQFEPALYTSMQHKGFDLVPYVNHFGNKPEDGWPEFWDSPRYGSGYGTLWHSFSFVPETHMLKPYDQRVRSTYALMQAIIEFTTKNSDRIRDLRAIARQESMTATEFPIAWSLDRSQSKKVLFKGYVSGYKTSEVSGKPRLYYDRSQPFEKEIPIFNFYTAKAKVTRPEAYIIPQGWWKVIDLLKLNGVQMHRLTKDSTLMVEVYHIDDYKSLARQYEMHHLNYEVKTSRKKETITFRKGDWFIPMNQVANRFLIETLEPEAEDSYFAWNFFDAILSQKEGYSAYAFEDIAAKYLATNPALRSDLELKRAADTAFANSGRAQLDYVYQQSMWFEPAYLRYPVYRLVK